MTPLFAIVAYVVGWWSCAVWSFTLMQRWTAHECPTLLADPGCTRDDWRVSMFLSLVWPITFLVVTTHYWRFVGQR